MRAPSALLCQGAPDAIKMALYPLPPHLFLDGEPIAGSGLHFMADLEYSRRTSGVLDIHRQYAVQLQAAARKRNISCKWCWPLSVCTYGRCGGPRPEFLLWPAIISLGQWMWDIPPAGEAGERHSPHYSASSCVSVTSSAHVPRGWGRGGGAHYSAWMASHCALHTNHICLFC